MQQSSYYKGVGLAVMAAILWGVSGSLVQFLFEHRGVELEWMISCRLLAAGILLIIFSGFNLGKEIWKPFTNKRDLLQLLIFSTLGMSAVQYTYFAAIKHSNAATATVIQYIGPVLIVIYLALKHRRWPGFLEHVAVVFAILGTFLLVTHGSMDTLVVSPKAFFYGIASAAALAFYTLQPQELLKKYKPAVIVGWALVIGGILFSFVRAPWSVGGIIWDIRTVLYVIFMIVFGTLVPFYAYLNAVILIGGQKASLLASAEPLAATLIAVIWLGVSFTVVDWIGSVLIVSTIFLISYQSRKSVQAQISRN